MTRRLLLIRLIVLATAILGLNYVAWRWLVSVNWDAWWIAVPLVLAETYSLVDSLLFGLGVWRIKERGEPPAAPEGLTVDVLIATYNEPVDLVMATARAAKAIRYPHQTWVLDDGNRPEMRAAAEAEGIGWITRGPEWAGMPRHAKAGNLNSAFEQTDGEFMLILDADQVPKPQILDRTLGYFTDEQVGLVQTQQFFVNVPEDDPLGSQAPLFYGPIQQSKDGWNAAFFCGSNAILRREAIIRVGVKRYADEVATRVWRVLWTADTVIDETLRAVPRAETRIREALGRVKERVREARTDLTAGDALFDVTFRFQRHVQEIRDALVAADAQEIAADLEVIAALERGLDGDDALLESAFDPATLEQVAHRDFSPLGAVDTISKLIEAVDVDRSGEAQAVMPMATISVTEDMATCMRMHALGWKSVYHDENFCDGLAPEDLATMLTQRLRWAQGTIQVMFKENPLVQKGLSWGQRLMYFATMWSYLSGFTAVVYLAAPVVYMVFGVLPVTALSTDFFIRLLPFLVVNQLLFAVVAAGRPTWRGMQYSLALFPVWIRAFTSAFGNVFLGRDLDFAVTPKTKQQQEKLRWDLVKPQLFAMAALVVAAVVGIVRIALGDDQTFAIAFNLLWIVFDLAMLSIIVRAVRYRGYEPPTTEGAADAAPTIAETARPTSAADPSGERSTSEGAA